MQLHVDLFQSLDISFEVLDTFVKLTLTLLQSLDHIFDLVVSAAGVELQLQFVDGLLVLDLVVEQLLDLAHAVADDQLQLPLLQSEHLGVPVAVAAVALFPFVRLLRGRADRIRLSLLLTTRIA